MPADQNKHTERLIAEPLCARLGIDRTSAQAVASGNYIAAFGPRAASLPLEANRIVDALHAICALPEGSIVMWCGRPHKIFRPHPANPTKGTQLIGRAGSERAAQIVLAPVDQPDQHIFTKFAVIPNGKYAPGKPLFFLECEGNPTTLMTGNNVLPVTSRNPKTKAIERYPSSAHNVMTTLNRLLFRFLEDIAAQITSSDAALFEPETQAGDACATKDAGPRYPNARGAQTRTSRWEGRRERWRPNPKGLDATAKRPHGQACRKL